ncbi:MAG: hypothetical protein ACREH4_11035 [Vitreimonas sp.]
MIRRMGLAAAALALAACSPPQAAQAPEAPAAETPAMAAQPAAAEAPAGASDAITAWYRQRLGATLIEPVEVFYGDFSGDGAADAVAWAYHSTEGNMTEHVLALFRNEGGQMTFVRTEDSVQGSEPTNVAVSAGRVTLTTKTHTPSDPGCCPTGASDWVIEVN